MIHRAQILAMLLNACPGFQSAWDEHVAYWEGKEARVYNDTAEFVSYLDHCREQGDFAPIRSALDILERLLTEGDGDTQEIATIGLLEAIQNVAQEIATIGLLGAIQNVASHSGSQETYERYLGPQSRQVWRKLEKDWEQLMQSKGRVPRTENCS